MVFDCLVTTSCIAKKIAKEIKTTTRTINMFFPFKLDSNGVIWVGGTVDAVEGVGWAVADTIGVTVAVVSVVGLTPTLPFGLIPSVFGGIAVFVVAVGTCCDGACCPVAELSAMITKRERQYRAKQPNKCPFILAANSIILFN